MRTKVAKRGRLGVHMACDHTPAARSSKYALRSYLYLLLHAAVAGPAALLFGTGAGAALHARHSVCFRRPMPRVCYRRQGGSSPSMTAAAQHKSGRQARNFSHVVRVSMLQLDRHARLLHACLPHRLAALVTDLDCTLIGLAGCESPRHEAGCRRQGVGVLPDQGGPGDAVCPVRDRALPVRPACGMAVYVGSCVQDAVWCSRPACFDQALYPACARAAQHQ